MGAVIQLLNLSRLGLNVDNPTICYALHELLDTVGRDKLLLRRQKQDITGQELRCVTEGLRKHATRCVCQPSFFVCCHPSEHAVFHPEEGTDRGASFATEKQHP